MSDTPAPLRDATAHPGNPPAPRPLNRLAVGLLMALGTLGQLALNIVLPSLPAIGEELDVAAGSERLVLSVFLIGFASGQLLVGPLSDRYGRRRILIPGLLLYAVLGGGAALTASIDWLLAARLLQGLGAAAGFVIARAIARDAFQGAALVRIFGLLTLTMGIVPGIAPIIGGFVQDYVGWQANMAITMVMGGVMFVLCLVAMPETGTPSDTTIAPGAVAMNYVSIFRDRTFRRFALTNALTLGSLYAFHAGGPELMIRQLGLSPSSFGFLAFLHSSAYMAGAASVSALSARIQKPSTVIVTSALTMCASGFAMLTVSLTGHASVATIMVFMVIFGFALGVILPLGVAGSLSPFKSSAGTATALLGALQMSAGAAASAVVAAFPDIPGIAFPIVIIVMTAAAAINARPSKLEPIRQEIQDD
ncbi:MAG: multidrug effflux MFS transporter [Rhodospirillales bacterium]|nr:multidrug effflux MFS transporter [Rhodospirillales bacterium]MBO6785791.1 multidrug effflux MFS transporter [Rhodospirillales bacterium]